MWISSKWADDLCNGSCDLYTYRVPLSVAFPVDPKGTYSTTIVNPSPPKVAPVEPWTISAYLAKHWPEMDISKVHLADKFVEGDLEAGERPCLADEYIKKGDQYCTSSKWQAFMSDYAHAFAAKRGCPDNKVKTSRPLPKQEWSLTGYLAKHWPSWGDRKPHRDDFTQEMLEGGWRPLFVGEPFDRIDEFFYCAKWQNREAVDIGHYADKSWCPTRTKRPLPITDTAPEPTYRALLPDEKVQEGDECKVDGGSWAVSCSKVQHEVFEYRTLRPLPSPEIKEAWRPKEGDYYDMKTRDGNWTGPHRANTDCTTDKFFERFNCRPASPPEKAKEPSIPDLASQLLVHAINYSTITEPEPNTPMNTAAQSATPEINLPLPGTKWGLVLTDGTGYRGQVIASGSKGIILKGIGRSKKVDRLIPVANWGTGHEIQIFTRRQLRRQAKAQPIRFTGEYVSTPKKRSFLRRFTVGTLKTAGLLLAGSIFSAPIKFGLGAAFGVLWSYVSQFVK
jgi:hypothetical protein